MSNPGPMLVSASDTIKAWEAEHMNILKQYGTENLEAGSSFKDVAWNTDNSKLAAVSNGSGIVLYDITERAANEVTVLPKSEEQTCVCFGSDKSYFFSGGATGDVNVWNFLTRKLVKTFESGHKSPVRRITRVGNGNIASACPSGEIIIWHADDCHPLTRLRASKGKSVRGLGHSVWERAVLGTSSDDGLVSLWDIEKQAIKRTFSSHDAPAMDLSFSPMNHLLLASCGLDKKIIFHDIHGGDIVITITSTQPVTAVCMLSNGAHVCAGTSMGSILKYDLRNKSEPLSTINAHSTSVQRLVLETLKERSRKDKRSSKTETSNSTQRKPSRVKEEVKGSQPTEKQEQKLRASQDTTKNRRSLNKVPEVELHPIDLKHVNVSNHSHTSPVPGMLLRKSQIDKPYGLQTPLNKSNASSRRDTLGSYCEGIFSPVANMNESVQGDVVAAPSQSKPLRNSRGYTPQGSLSARPMLNFNALSIAKVNGDSEKARNNYANGKETLDSAAFVSSDITQNRSSVMENPATVPCTPVYSSTPSNHSTNSVSNPDSEEMSNSKNHNSNSHADETPVNALVNGNHMADGASSSHHQPNFTQLNPFQYQLELLQSTVRDVVEDHEDNIRDEIRHFHMQVIKMFAKQNETIQQLAEQCSVNPLLLQEIERLRNENDRLRRKF